MFRNRWARRIAFSAISLLILGVVGFFAYRYFAWQSGESRYAAITAQLDATDPGWRLEPADVPHAPVPDDENSALLVPKFKAALAGGKFEVKRADGKYFSSTGEPNRLPDEEEIAAVDQAFVDNYAALAIARSFVNHPHGWRTRPPGVDLLSFRLGDVADTRTVFSVLNEEAKRLGRDGRPGVAFEFVRAMLNAVRSIDGDITMIDTLIHIAGDATVVGRVQGLLAQTHPRGSLGLLQAALAEEAESDFVWHGFRGERALVHQTMLNIGAGKYAYRSAIALDPKASSPPNAEFQARDLLEAPRLPAEHSGFLELSTKVCEAAQLPLHQQRAAFRAIEVPSSPPILAAVGKDQLNSFGKVLDASLRVKAQLRCAVVGLACERDRLRTGRWPDGLNAIPKDILSTVPFDPFDGKSIRYVRRKDGVTVYSIGQDEHDNGGEVGEFGVGIAPGTDICFRLYNPDQRALPPLQRAPSPDDPPGPKTLDEPPGAPEPRVIREEP
jgi:hypothetical protein